jgi:transmembrane sensor
MDHQASSKSSSKLNPQIYSEACEWFVQCRSGALDDTARREFDRWLRKSPEHLSAYLEVAAIWNEGPALDPQHQWDAERLIATAAADDDNVIPLPLPAAPMESLTTVQPVARSRKPQAIAASVAIIALAVSALVWSVLLRAPTYTTGVGEQRSIVLTDGSTVELNSRSKVTVRYSKRERAIALLEGQALFRVAKDHARPFVVTSGDTRVRAVGTQFDVYKKHSGTIVTVVEGKVAILTSVADPDLEPMTVDPATVSRPPSLEIEEQDSERGGAGPSILLSAGEQATVTRATIQAAIHPNIASAIAWRQRQLVFESASLVEVAEEFNRYNERQLVVRDAELYEFHISGVFSSTDSASLIRFLRERPGVQVIETASEIQVTKKIHQEVTDR